MKGNAIIRIVIYSLLIVILLSIMTGAMGYGHDFHDGKLRWSDTSDPIESSNDVNQLDVYTQIQNIEIDWVAGSISIHKSDSLDHISVSEVSIDEKAPKMVCSRDGQTLKIEFSKEEKRFHLFGNNESLSKDLVIRVPKNWNCNNL